jgi:twinfilin
LVPKTTIPSTSSFYADLSNLKPYLKPNEALYILLRLDTPAATPAFAAVTYVPNAAPVRQKTLFASTRLTLVRELGSENFADTIFTTEAEELTEQGWKSHEAHGEAENPLTEEERNLVGIKEAEATEAGGTARRGAGYGSSGVKMASGAGVVEALRDLQEGGLVSLVSRIGLPRLLLMLTHR